MTERVVAERMVLANKVDGWFRLDEPVFIDAGQAYWIDREAGELCIDRGDGRVTRHAGGRCRCNCG